MEYSANGGKSWQRSGYMQKDGVTSNYRIGYKIGGLKAKTTYKTRIRYGEYVTYQTDVDGDGKITSSDSLIILRASVKLESLSAEQFKCADVDGDKVISSGDALSVLRCSVHLLDNENIGKPIEKSVL